MRKPLSIRPTFPLSQFAEDLPKYGIIKAGKVIE